MELLDAKHYAKCFTQIFSLSPHSNQGKEEFLSPCVGEETEVLRS